MFTCGAVPVTCRWSIGVTGRAELSTSAGSLSARYEMSVEGCGVSVCVVFGVSVEEGAVSIADAQAAKSSADRTIIVKIIQGFFIILLIELSIWF